MPNKVSGRVVKVDTFFYGQCDKRVTINCETSRIQGTGWMTPTAKGGVLLSEYQFSRDIVKPEPDSIHVIRVREEGGRNVYFAIADGADESVLTDLCNACCDGLSELPDVTFPTPIVEEGVCVVTEATAPSYQFSATAGTLGAGERYTATGSKDGVAFPALAADGYASLAALKTAIDGAWGSFGTFTLVGNKLTLSSPTEYSTASLNIDNLAQPVVNAGPDQPAVATATAALAGTATSPDGIASVLWTKVSGPGGSGITNPTQLNATVTGLVTGAYNFRLTATSNGGLTGTDTVLITHT